MSANKPTQVFKIDFKPNPTQHRFIASRHEADLMDCRKGEGKSAALVWACFYHTQHNRGADWLIIRDTWANLERTTLREFFRWWPPGIVGEWKAAQKVFIWKLEQLGVVGRVTFIGLDDPNDASKVASMPLAGFGMDEPAPAAGESGGIDKLIFQTAMAQLRQPGMKWYAAKLAQNNPDEGHWTYDRFWVPGTPNMRPLDQMPPMQVPGFKGWQPPEPENEANLPKGYYAGLRQVYRDQPDLIRRNVEGKHGYQQVGVAVTPEWSDKLHLAKDIRPVRGPELVMLWDFGLTPCCLITQVTPLGHWNFLWGITGEHCGVEELIVDHVKPLLARDFKGFTWRNVGDPAGLASEQSSVRNSAVRVIRREIGGRWTSGPQHPISARVDPLRAVLRRLVGGVALVQVDRDRAKPVWHALRGAWHYNQARTGIIGDIAKTHPASDVGDCCGYGAAVLFPLAQLTQPGRGTSKLPQPSFFGDDRVGRKPEFARPWINRVPEHGERL